MSQITNHQSPITNHSDEINLLDYWRVIKKYKKMIAAIVAAASVAAVIISLLLPKSFKAEAVIIPVSSKSGGGGLSALASQFGGLASLAGVGLPGGAGDTEKIVAILKSRTLTENVINRENLMPILFEKAWDARAGKWKSDDPKKQPNMELAVNGMKEAVSTMDDKKNKTIKITGEFKDPQLAARVVNVYLDELQSFINANAFTTAKRNRIFIEDQLEQNKEELLAAGKEINEFYSGKKVSSSDAKIDVPLNREPRGTIPSPFQPKADPPLAEAGEGRLPAGALVAGGEGKNPVQTAGLTSDLTEPGSDAGHVSRVTGNDTELSALINQKADIEKKITEAKVVKNVPQQVYLTYLMLRRELLAKVNALLTTQYEMAKIEESKEDLAFQVIDKAVPPVLRFSPKRAQICMMSFMAALFGAVFLAFFREYVERMKSVTRNQ
jgi:uncharacterized protein involved in exopolysaccharide biosynthesis